MRSATENPGWSPGHRDGHLGVATLQQIVPSYHEMRAPLAGPLLRLDGRDTARAMHLKATERCRAVGCRVNHHRAN